MTASSWYRRSLWNYKGNREYTRSGYEAAATRFVEDDLDVDCSDRHYMITGANSGIGLQTALEVARRGGIIHMVCRNQEAATRARSEIITTTGNDKIHLHFVDLAKPREVVLWAQQFAAQHECLHVLMHNAGCMVHERQMDSDGVEANFAVNTLAVHIITLTLMPVLQRSEDSRVVMVSSAGMLCVRLEPHDLMHTAMQPFDGRLVYSQNKRQQVVMGLWYAQRYNKVHFASMHPGWVDTPAVRTALPQFYEMMKDNLRTPAQGADTVVWLAISKAALKHPSGLFFQDREPVSSHLPLAWTKSTIEEEDFLMTNIQDIYTKIYNKMFPQAADAQGTSPTTSQSPSPMPQSEAAAASQTSMEEGEGLKGKEEGAKGMSKEEEAKVSESKVEETSLIEHSLKTETETPAFPVLPPPPPPAGKVTPSKSEVQEVAEIHAPPASSQRKDNIAPETNEEPKPSQSHEEKKTDMPEEKKTDMPEERKTDMPEEKKTDIPEERKTDMPEEKKTDKPEEKKTDKPEEKKTDKPEEKKADKPEEKKADTPEDKREDSGLSAHEKEEERTEALQEDKGKVDATSPPTTSDPAAPEP